MSMSASADFSQSNSDEFGSSQRPTSLAGSASMSASMSMSTSMSMSIGGSAVAHVSQVGLNRISEVPHIRQHSFAPHVPSRSATLETNRNIGVKRREVLKSLRKDDAPPPQIGNAVGSRKTSLPRPNRGMVQSESAPVLRGGNAV